MSRPRIWRAVAILALLSLAPSCAGTEDAPRPRVNDSDDPPDDSPDDSEDPACPAGSVLVADFCIDAWETTVTGDPGNNDQGAGFPDGSTAATSEASSGVLATERMSWYQSFAICVESGRHLCTVDEWQTACGASTYPWGTTPDAASVCALANADGTTTWAGPQPTGSLAECGSPEGVLDQIGNLWEWADPGETTADGTPETAKLGGAWYAGGGDGLCGVPAHAEHPPTFDGSIGFRCCSAG